MIFKNDKSRRAYLDTWPKWPVLVTVPELNLTVHEKQLPDGSRILVFDHGPRPLDEITRKMFPGAVPKHVYHKLLVPPVEMVTGDRTSDTTLANFLKNFQEGI